VLRAGLAHAIDAGLGNHLRVHVSVAQWLVLSATVIAAATVQGVVVFGSTLLAVPVVALIVPSALPGAMVFPGVPMAVTMAVAERSHVDWRGSRFLILGRLPGTLIGVAGGPGGPPRAARAGVGR